MYARTDGPITIGHRVLQGPNENEIYSTCSVLESQILSHLQMLYTLTQYQMSGQLYPFSGRTRPWMLIKKKKEHDKYLISTSYIFVF